MGLQSCCGLAAAGGVRQSLIGCGGPGAACGRQPYSPRPDGGGGGPGWREEKQQHLQGRDRDLVPLSSSCLRWGLGGLGLGTEFGAIEGVQLGGKCPNIMEVHGLGTAF